MKLPGSFICSIILLVGITACQKSPVPPPDWPALTQESKPWTRWWWQGSGVSQAGIRAELQAFREAGIGGLELTPIYGVIGEEEGFIDYLSPQWMDMLEFTLQEASRLGLGIDMATGTGWPFGGPWVETSDASKYLAHKTYPLKAGEKLKEPVRYEENGFVRAVNNQVHPEAVQLSDLVEPVAQNENLQALALDQVRFHKELPLASLMAYSAKGEVINLLDKVGENGILNWTAPEGEWTLYAIFQGWHGKMVERAAPGGEGNVIDHFSTEAIRHYLDRFDEAFQGRNLTGLRSFFNDSYEVDDARGQANWTPKLLEAFHQKHGYDLREHWPDLLGEERGETHQRVLSDFRETISDLLLETFAQEWGTWAKSKGKLIRYQAHGSPSNILDLYAAADIPETEGTDLIRIKFASSAAHVAGRKLASAEAATWLDEHFRSNLADLKQNLDRYLVGGVNHLFYHGTCYSPPDDPWPGRLFYAAIHANPRNSLWRDMGDLNQYIARTQSFLQAGKPDNDVLLYFPAYDRFASPQLELLDHFDGHGPSLEGTHFEELADTLVKSGFAFDYISDRQIEQLTVEDELLQTGGIGYKTLLVPQTQFLPLLTLEKLKELASQGARIIFHKQLPQRVPGLAQLSQRQQAFEALLEGLRFSMARNGIEAVPLGSGQWLKGKDALALLAHAGVARESLVDHGLHYARRTYQDGSSYFLANWSVQAVNAWVPLQTEARTVMLFDPMTGKKGKAQLRKGKEGTSEVLLQLSHGRSMVLITSNADQVGEDWLYGEQTERVVALTGPWDLQFVSGGPTLPEPLSTDSLRLWTDWNKEAYHNFSGTARYQTTFAKPAGMGSAWLLDLGTVHESARISLNGQELGVLVGPVYQLMIPEALIQETNTLEIAVSNLMANRIADLDRRAVFWKKFYNVNFPPRRRENLGRSGIFDASAWEVLPSGLGGPVRLLGVSFID